MTCLQQHPKRTSKNRIPHKRQLVPASAGSRITQRRLSRQLARRRLSSKSVALTATLTSSSARNLPANSVLR
jgi:hypothetical protein